MHVSGSLMIFDSCRLNQGFNVWFLSWRKLLGGYRFVCLASWSGECAVSLWLLQTARTTALTWMLRRWPRSPPPSFATGASVCTPCSPGSYSNSTGACVGGLECLLARGFDIGRVRGLWASWCSCSCNYARRGFRQNCSGARNYLHTLSHVLSTDHWECCFQAHSNPTPCLVWARQAQPGPQCAYCALEEAIRRQQVGLASLDLEPWAGGSDEGWGVVRRIMLSCCGLIGPWKLLTRENAGANDKAGLQRESESVVSRCIEWKWCKVL